jgi:predicted O-linked N-acetylglucosamine transferase (SPINDLY family)
MEPSAAQLIQEGLRLHRQGLLAEALPLYTRALQSDPNNAELHYYIAAVCLQQSRPRDAIISAQKSIALNPEEARAHRLLGQTLNRLGRQEEALASFDRAIAIAPEMAEAHGARADLLADMNRNADAVASYNRALALQPGSISDLCNLGATLDKIGRHDEAVDCYDRLIALKPDFAEAYFNRGISLSRLARHREAIASFDAALALRPNYGDALNNRGLALAQLQQGSEALATFDRLLAMEPRNVSALYNRGNVLKDLGQYELASPDLIQVLAIDPDHKYAPSGMIECAIRLCDWRNRDKLPEELRRDVMMQQTVINPFMLLSVLADDALQSACAQKFVHDRIAKPLQPLAHHTPGSNQRIKIAYLSADFHDHATAQLMAELFELHDRARFEISAISYGPDDQSAMRARLIKAFDRFHDVHLKTDRQAALLIQEHGTDIAVDLKGYTAAARFEILAHRPAPIQVSYLGYPGTMAADFIDYIIGDRVVLPFDRQRFYTERIVHLPDSYQVNDSKKLLSSRNFTRLDMGLPERGFVFCDFNNNYKITPQFFDVWMRLLRACDGSVLWLLRDSKRAEMNLRNEAAAREVDPSRLVFADRLPLDQHLARHRLADLFLDTLPYNAHTTASDALWAGLPVLTCLGETFPGRVAASLLQAVGLPELVSRNLEEYEQLALRLVREKELLTASKAKLAQNRKTYALFDPKRFARHIEAAYTTMWETWRRGELPKAFAVEPIPSLAP